MKVATLIELWFFCLPKQFFQYSMCVSIFLEEQDVIINSSVTQIHLLRLDLSTNDCNYFKESKMCGFFLFFYQYLE